MTLTSAVTGADGRTLTGREYLRVSRDPSGRMASPDEQHAENAADAAAEGIVLGEPYREARAVSASAYSAKARDGFDALLGDLEAGRFGADVLYLWEASRGSRRVSEWCDLLDLTAKRGVLIRVKTHGRTYDPRNARDRRTLLEDAVDSEWESSKTRDRLLRSAAAMAAAGRPTGQPPLGYRAVYDPRNGKLENWEPDPEWAPLVAELYQRIAEGHSLRSISRDWEERGLVNGRGRPFLTQHIRMIATRATYAGLRTHHGELTEATWDAIVAPELWWTVQRILNDPKRKTTRGGRAVHALTMIMRCGKCGGPMTAVNRRARPEYMCARYNHVRIDRAGVDDEVIGAMLAYLSRADLHETLSAAGDDSPEVAQVRADLAAARKELADAESAEPDTVAEARVFARLIDRLTPRVAELENRERELTTPSALLRLIAPGADVAERWADAPVSTKREVARILLSPDRLGEVRINPSPAPPGHTCPAADRIEWWTGDDDRP